MITEKNLTLPTGAIATVEASGLGGSKALEIYPPDDKNPTNKIIATKSPTRLSHVMGLFDNIFKELDSIITTLTHASNQFEFTSTGTIPKNIVIPEDTNKQLDNINKTLDTIINTEKDFMRNFNKK